MMPRPRSRKHPVSAVDVSALAEEIRQAKFVWGPPLAIAVGIREWRAAKRDPGYGAHAQFWPGGEETFDQVPVVVRRDLGAPQVLITQAEVEDVLLEDRR